MSTGKHMLFIPGNNGKNMKHQNRVLAIHDLSCFGRCSLTTALPIISATGVECTVIPTAVLSTHTGGITGYTFRDMTDDILPTVNHWETLNLKFDGIYTGFLGSKEQIDVVIEVIDRLGKNALVIVDPAMADAGKMYPVFDDTFPKEMKRLCSKADIIVPNITEACFMLSREYVKGPYTEEFILDLLKDLCKFGCKKVVLTGVHFDNEKLGAATYDSKTDEINYYFRDIIQGYYHGTGDVFAAALTASLMNNRSLKDSASIAVDFTVGSIERTLESGKDIRFGVDFEQGLFDLTKEIRQC